MTDNLKQAVQRIAGVLAHLKQDGSLPKEHTADITAIRTAGAMASSGPRDVQLIAAETWMLGVIETALAADKAEAEKSEETKASKKNK